MPKLSRCASALQKKEENKSGIGRRFSRPHLVWAFLVLFILSERSIWCADADRAATQPVIAGLTNGVAAVRKYVRILTSAIYHGHLPASSGEKYAWASEVESQVGPFHFLVVRERYSDAAYVASSLHSSAYNAGLALSTDRLLCPYLSWPVRVSPRGELRVQTVRVGKVGR